MDDREIVVYFVGSIFDGMHHNLDGCTFANLLSPSCIVTKSSSKWVVAHEIGHALGAKHREPPTDPLALMNAQVPADDTTPKFLMPEIETIQHSGNFF